MSDYRKALWALYETNKAAIDEIWNTLPGTANVRAAIDEWLRRRYEPADE